jgi:hypothetical protein
VDKASFSSWMDGQVLQSTRQDYEVPVNERSRGQWRPQPANFGGVVLRGHGGG